MDAKQQQAFRFLKFYAAVSSLVLAGLLYLTLRGPAATARFDVIDVERINIVEKSGELRLAIANRDRSSGVVMGGKYMRSREGKRPGMIFFNDNGDECGGMTWYGYERNGEISANGGLMFDQYNQDQTVGITYSQDKGDRTSGLMVWERPLMSPEDMEVMKRLGDLEVMPDGPEKTAALKQWREDVIQRNLAGALRVFVGRGRDNSAAVKLNDPSGKPRILLSVDGAGTPSLKFLDEQGNVTLSIPEEGQAR